MPLGVGRYCVRNIALLLLTLLPFVAGQYTQEQCEKKVQSYHNNGTFTWDDYWHGSILGLDDKEMPPDMYTLSEKGKSEKK